MRTFTRQSGDVRKSGSQQPLLVPIFAIATSCYWNTYARFLLDKLLNHRLLPTHRGLRLFQMRPLPIPLNVNIEYSVPTSCFFTLFWRSFVFPIYFASCFFRFWSFAFWFSMCFPFFFAFFPSSKNIRTKGRGEHKCCFLEPAGVVDQRYQVFLQCDLESSGPVDPQAWVWAVNTHSN